VPVSDVRDFDPANPRDLPLCVSSAACLWFARCRRRGSFIAPTNYNPMAWNPRIGAGYTKRAYMARLHVCLDINPRFDGIPRRDFVYDVITTLSDWFSVRSIERYPQLLTRRSNVLCAGTQYTLACVCRERKSPFKAAPMAPIGRSNDETACGRLYRGFMKRITLSPVTWRKFTVGNGNLGIEFLSLRCTSWIMTGSDFLRLILTRGERRSLGEKRIICTCEWDGIDKRF